MITRRVTQRQFLLLPSAEINQIVLYCIAYAARESGLVIHAVCALSNHVHIVATDPEAKLPHFSYLAFKDIGKCVNAKRGRWENMWAAGVQPSYVRLVDAATMLKKTAYVIGNPVESCLVRRSGDWPGVSLWRPGKYKVKRPRVFFDKKGPMPESIQLEIQPVPLGDDLSRREVIELVGKAIADHEKDLRAKNKAEGRSYLGVHRVLSQNPYDSPTSQEPRRKLSPRVATKDKWRRIEVLQRLKEFWDDYKIALGAWCAGKRDVVFPSGVYKMRVQFGVRCAEC
jgi:hypothetical protein